MIYVVNCNINHASTLKESRRPYDKLLHLPTFDLKNVLVNVEINIKRRIINAVEVLFTINAVEVLFTVTSC